MMYHVPRFWLKEMARENMLDMVVADETSQSLRGWLKARATWNMPRMSVTEETFQSLRGLLK